MHQLMLKTDKSESVAGRFKTIQEALDWMSQQGKVKVTANGFSVAGKNYYIKW